MVEDSRYFQELKDGIDEGRISNENEIKVDKEREKDLWKAFYKHFRKRNRERIYTNHHDFIDLPSIKQTS